MLQVGLNVPLHTKPRVPKNIIFLDIDGVLISPDSWKENKGKRQIVHSVDGQFKCSVAPFGSKAVENLRTICEGLDVGIVICSTLRFSGCETFFQDCFAEAGWKGAPVIGSTPHTRSMRRSDECEAWFYQQKLNMFDHRYLAIDDDLDYAGFFPLIHTCNLYGLSSTDTLVALAYFSGGKRLPPRKIWFMGTTSLPEKLRTDLAAKHKLPDAEASHLIQHGHVMSTPYGHAVWKDIPAQKKQMTDLYAIYEEELLTWNEDFLDDKPIPANS